MGRWANKHVIGLTGNIAMGKSLVRKMLENLGAYTIDADGLAHQAMAPGAPTYAPIVETFGKWILDADKRIDRQKLGAVVFSHNDALNILEQITHPIVGQAIDILINRAKQPIIVVEAIKLVDGVLGSQVDTVWVVDSTPETQLQRMTAKRGMSDWEARKRIETQNPQAEKLAKANVIIHNDGSAEDVYNQVQAELQKIIAVLRGGAVPAPVAPPAQPLVQQQPVTVVSTPTIPVATPVASPQPPRPPQPIAAPVQQQPPAAATPAPVRPAPPPSKPIVQPVQTGILPAASTVSAGPVAIEIKRGNPKTADAIARFLTQFTGKQVARLDIMIAFGEKSYLFAEAAGHIIGLSGFQVENLITRVDEFFILPDAPLNMIAKQMIGAVEEASRELQSEVGFVFMPRTAPQNMLQAFFDQGYERIEIEALKVPAWRESAAESQTPDRQILMKKLRSERVLKPV